MRPTATAVTSPEAGKKPGDAPCRCDSESIANVRLGCVYLVVLLLGVVVLDRTTNRERVVDIRPPLVRFRPTNTTQEDIVDLPVDYLVGSSSHCFGSNLQTESSWLVRTCYYKNVCLNATSKEFYYLVDDVRNTTAVQNEELEPVSISPYFFKWNPPDFPPLKFTPTKKRISDVIRSREFVFRYPKRDLVALYQAYISVNVGHLFLEDYWLWYLNSALAALLRDDLEQPFSIRPVWRNSVARDPPYLTCDWFRAHTGPGHSIVSTDLPKKCLEFQEKFLKGIIGPKNTVVLETNNRDHWDNSTDLHCFPHLVVGAGPYRNSILGQDAWEGVHERAPATFGRGPLLLEMRNMVYRNLGYQHLVHQPKLSNANPEVLVVFSSHSSFREPINFDKMQSAFEKYAMEIRLNDTLKTVTGNKYFSYRVYNGILSSLSFEEQVKLIASQPTVYLTAGGGGAFSGWFLSTGSSMILFAREGRNDDWKAYQSMNWFRATYFDLPPLMDQKNTTAMDNLCAFLAREVVSAALFGFAT